MARLEPTEHKFLNCTMIHIPLCSFQMLTRSKAMHNVSAHQLRLELLMSRDISIQRCLVTICFSCKRLSDLVTWFDIKHYLFIDITTILLTHTQTYTHIYKKWYFFCFTYIANYVINIYIYIYIYIWLLYRGKEKIHSKRKRYTVKILNCILTQVLQSDKYYKSLAVGVTSEVGLTPDRRPFRVISLLLFLLLPLSTSFILPQYRKLCGTSHYTTMIEIRGKVDKSNTTGLLVIFRSLLTEKLHLIKHFLRFSTF